jgi:hypothetical protein
MPSKIDRRLKVLESRRDDKRRPVDMTDDELVQLIHGRKLTPVETADYMRKLEAKLENRNANP